jgi:hypothetical protein
MCDLAKLVLLTGVPQACMLRQAGTAQPGLDPDPEADTEHLPSETLTAKRLAAKLTCKCQLLAP